MKDYSIEYAHIYTNQEIDLEHEFATSILNNLFSEIKGTKSLVVMVDDYSFPDPTFNYFEMSKYIKSKGFIADVIIRESQLIASCDKLLSKMENNSLKKSLINYIISNKKYPCSLFIATWYLIRLGKIKSSFFDKNFTSKNLINILPKSFEPFEEKALEIIKKTEYKNSIKNIENKYFEGRILA